MEFHLLKTILRTKNILWRYEEGERERENERMKERKTERREREGDGRRERGGRDVNKRNSPK